VAADSRPFTQGIQGQATDIQLHAQEILRQRESMARIYAKHTGRQLEDVERAMERDFFMNPQEAKDWGLIDLIVDRNAAVRVPGGTKVAGGRWLPGPGCRDPADRSG
jgi:ATP-dependent Clp protease, protease subunit